MPSRSAIGHRASKTPLVGIVDYGMGNLRSVAKSFEAAGARTVVSDTSGVLSKADLLVVPGVGAFGDAMAALRKKGLDRFIRRWVDGGRPYFGICLGLQVLFESSEEAPGAKGLGLLRGRVRRFHSRNPRFKVPHMGWNRLAPGPALRRNGRETDRLLKDHFYFVHSYFPAPEDSAAVWFRTEYGGKFCSAVARGNIAATQFHPEKSGAAGLRFLRRILKELPQKSGR